MHGPGARGVKQVSPPTMPMSESHLFALPPLPHQVLRPLASSRWLVFPHRLHTTMESQLPTTVLIFIHKQCFSPPYDISGKKYVLGEIYEAYTFNCKAAALTFGVGCKVEHRN